MRTLGAAFLLTLYAGPAAAELAVDGGLVSAHPAALDTGLSMGVGAGVTRRCGGPFVFGARASWSTATEYAAAWEVTHDDLRLRFAGALEGTRGAGTVGLRLGAGMTLVYEDRLRMQGDRAGLSGDELSDTAWAFLPGAELEATVSLRLAGAWRLELAGGPSVHLLDGSASVGWLSEVGVAWRP